MVYGEVKFPIVRHMVYHGVTSEKRLNKNDVVKCLFCGQKITLNEKTVKLAPDGMQIVGCPYFGCYKKVAVLDYFGKVEKPLKAVGKKKKKYKEYQKNILKEPKPKLITDLYTKEAVAS